MHGKPQARCALWTLMKKLPLLLLLTFTPALANAQPLAASLNTVPAARSLFERDWVLMNWALKFHDGNRDILLDLREAEAAAVEFRRIADANNDGRVTTQEYRAAREFLLARY
jgi:hypothetical protein